VITSSHNERVKLVRALQSSGKTRRKERRLALEGVRLIDDALKTGIAPDYVLYTADVMAGDQAGSRLFAILQERSIPCLEVAPDIMLEMADTETPQGMIAVVPLPELAVPSNISLALICDGIADPGNLGTMLRTAGAASVDVVVLAPHCVDPFNPKVLRGGMGAHFRIPIMRQAWPEIERDFARLPLYLADAGGEMVYHRIDWTQPCGLIIGGEAHGADLQARQLAHTILSIPMGNHAESLNAAVATGIILFECRRQRMNT
jgi:TrmH family RNA methyltransferase